jgi:Ca-activated chloride channel family protein
MSYLQRLCWMPLLAASWQSATQPPVRSEAVGIRLDVLVSHDGRPVGGLTGQDFEVTDNGVLQRIQVATAADGVRIVIVLDTSYSVLTDSRVDLLVSAGTMVVRGLQAGDTAAVISFSRGAQLLSAPTSDASVIERTLLLSRRGVFKRRGDATAMWDAILAGASLVTGTQGRPVVVILTDGGDNASWLFRNQPDSAPWMRGQKRRTIDVLRNSGVVVDVVWVPPDRDSRTGRDDVYGAFSPDDPATLTGGMAFPAGDQHLERRLRARLAALRAGYVLTYTPSGVRRDDGWHTVRVRLKGRKGKIEARPGYFAGAATPMPIRP